ncbi:nucleolar protein 14, partial [Tanacetum coccineum]
DDEDDDTVGDDDNVDVEAKPRDGKTIKIIKEQEDGLNADKKDAKVKLAGTQQVDLPYTIEAPKTMDDLTVLLDNRSDEEIIEAIRRIRAFNAIKVEAEN